MNPGNPWIRSGAAMILAVAGAVSCLAADPPEGRLPLTNAPTPATRVPETTPPRLSLWTSEVLKLSSAGVDEVTILAFVDGTAGTFNLGAEEILYLKAGGVDDAVIRAMQQHDGDIARGVLPVMSASTPAVVSPIPITLVPRSSLPPPAPATAGEETSLIEPDETLSAEAGENPEVNPPLIASRTGDLGELYPVRKPYAEEIAPPILVYRECRRAPNVVSIELRY
jgi:hypothetical protein